MNTTFAVILAILVLGAVAAIILYNRLVAARAVTREAWSGIDVALTRRADLIPNLVETVKGYAKHEQGLLEQVTALRAQTMHCYCGHWCCWRTWHKARA